VDDILLLGRQDDRRFFNQVASYYGAPAYIRRANRVEAAFKELLDRCERQRAEWLALTRIRLGTLRMLAGDWSALRPLLRDGAQIEVLRQLDQALDPKPRLLEGATRSRGKLRRALRELIVDLEQFNRRMRAFLAGVDLAPVNKLRADYNRYYVLEKECAVRSARLARQGFVPLASLTVADLEAALPVLPVPQLFV
jgi:hypothetical protein